MIIGYVRTSDVPEAEENQVHLLNTYGVDTRNIFFDRGIPGSVSPFEREGYLKMIGFIRDHYVTHVYVCELRRLGGTPDGTLRVLSDIEHLGVCVQSLSPDESWWNCDPAVRPLIKNVMSWCVQGELENRIERTRAGIRKAKSEGRHCGRPFRQIDWAHVESLRKEMTYREIAEKINVPYITLIRRKKVCLTDMGGVSPGQGTAQ